MLLENLGNRLRVLRKERIGLSQEKFALRLGVDRTYYSAIERGKQNVTITILKKIADGFEMSLSEMLEGVE